MKKLLTILIVFGLFSCSSKSNEKEIKESKIIEPTSAHNNHDLQTNNGLLIDSNSTTKEYLNKELRFKISYPKEWTLIEGMTKKNPSVLSIMRDPYNRQDPLNLTLTVGPTSGDKDAFYEYNIKQMLIENPEIKIIEKDKISINSYDCYTTILEMPALDKSMKFKQYMFVENGISYYFISLLSGKSLKEAEA